MFIFKGDYFAYRQVYKFMYLSNLEMYQVYLGNLLVLQSSIICGKLTQWKFSSKGLVVLRLPRHPAGYWLVH